MSDIFISYANEDRPWARMLAEALREQGWSVWWDREIPFAKPFDEVIEEELEKARSVIVIWSKISITKRWVRAEAGDGLDRNLLIPILMEDIRPPLRFRHVQGASLIAWQGDTADLEFQRLLAALSQVLGSPPRQQAEDEERRRAEAEREAKEAEATRRAEEERKRAEAEEKRKAEEERKAEEAEARRKADEERKRAAAEEQRKAEAEAQRQAT